MKRARAVGSRRSERVAALLDDLFHLYHRPELIHPDPLEFLSRYADPLDREMVALLASGLAYGQVAGILRSVQRVLEALGPRPARTVAAATDLQLARRLAGFQHRWTRAEEVVTLVRVIEQGQRAWGSLGVRLAHHVRPGEPDLHPALQRWVGDLQGRGLPVRHSLVADPGRGSACKRLFLMARWLVRKDAVDPGGWDYLPPALLLVPTDVHMHRMARLLGFTRRRAADLQTVREITAGFRCYDAQDPARFDFALTRMPIHLRMDQRALRQRLTGPVSQP